MKFFNAFKLVVFFVFVLVAFSCNTVGVTAPDDFDGSTIATLMVYMSGGAGEGSLSHYAMADLEEIRVGTKGNHVRVVALVDIPEGTQPEGSWFGTRLYEIFNGEYIRKESADLGLSTNDGDNLDIGDASNLKKFVQYTLNEYEDEYYGLVLWGHGSGIWRGMQVSRTTERNNSYRTEPASQFLDDLIPDPDTANSELNTTLTTVEIGNALENYQNALLFVAFDTCLGAQYEVGYELAKKGAAKYMIASADLVPATGWDYYSVLSKISELVETPDSTSQTTQPTVPSERELITALVNGYIAAEARGSLVADISALKLDQYGALHTALTNYMKRLDMLLALNPTTEFTAEDNAIRKANLLEALGTIDANGNIEYSDSIQSYYDVYNTNLIAPSTRTVDIKSFVSKVQTLPGFEEDNFQTLSGVLLGALNSVVVNSLHTDNGRYLNNVGGLSLAFGQYGYNGEKRSINIGSVVLPGSQQRSYYYSTIHAEYHDTTKNDPNVLAFVAANAPSDYSYWTWGSEGPVTINEAGNSITGGAARGVLFRLFYENTPPADFAGSTIATVMVYMSGGAGEGSLSEYAMADLEEIRVGTKGNHVRAVVLVDIPEGTQPEGSWFGTRLYEIFNGEYIRKESSELGLSTNDGDNLDIGDANNLKKLVQYTLNEYEDEYYGLVLWGHGSGIWRGMQVSRSTERSSSYRSEPVSQFLDDLIPDPDIANSELNTTLTTVEIGNALENYQNALLFVAFDTCLGAQYEVAYELAKKGAAKYMIASADLVPATGWDYYSVLTSISKLAETPDSTSQTTQPTVPSEAELITALVNGYIAAETRGSLVADISALKLDQYGALHTAFTNYMKRLDMLLALNPTTEFTAEDNAIRKANLLEALGTIDANGNIEYSESIQSYYDVYNTAQNTPSTRTVDIQSFVSEVQTLAGFEETSFQTLSSELLGALNGVVVTRLHTDNGRYLDNAGGLSLAIGQYGYDGERYRMDIGSVILPGSQQRSYYYSTIHAEYHDTTKNDPHVLAFVAANAPGDYSYWTWGSEGPITINEAGNSITGAAARGVLFRLFYESA